MIDTPCIQLAAAAVAVMAIEDNLGYEPVDRAIKKLGNYIESKDHRTQKLRFPGMKRSVAAAGIVPQAEVPR